MAVMDRTTRVMIVDDHPLVRDGLAFRINLQVGMAVVAQAEGQDDALSLLRDIAVDVVLVDISLKTGNGIELIKRIRAMYPDIRILVLSGFDESLYGERSLRAGAQGYLNKQLSSEKLIEAIETVVRGRRYVSPALADRLVSKALCEKTDASSAIDTLSDRELQVLQMIGDGLTTGTIAQRLHVSPHTIDTHRENLKRKLGVNNAAELSRLAVQWVLQRD
jgi:DNA-binding NarL/FixJ family response regulator